MRTTRFPIGSVSDGSPSALASRRTVPPMKRWSSGSASNRSVWNEGARTSRCTISVTRAASISVATTRARRGSGTSAAALPRCMSGSARLAPRAAGKVRERITKLRHDVGDKALELFDLGRGREAQDRDRAPRLEIRAEALGHDLGRARDHPRLQIRPVENITVIRPEEVPRLVERTVRVGADVDHQMDAGPEGGRIAAGRRRVLSDPAPAPGELLDRDGVGHVAIAQTAHALER